MIDPASSFARERNRPEVEAAYAAAPDDRVAEIVDGELCLLPRPGPRHAGAASALGEELGPPFKRGRGGPGGWIILDEPELHLGPRPDKLGPDLAGWRRERLPAPPDDAAIATPPDSICEVLSPRTEAHDRGRKMRSYRREGVGHVWLLDPIEQTLEVYELEAQRWMVVETFTGAARVRAEPFDAIELDLAVLWSW